MITCHSLICQLSEPYDHAIVVKLMTHQCEFLYKVKILCKIPITFHVDNTSQSWSCDHPECQQRSLSFWCTCHLKTLSYCLQMAELPVNICKLYKTRWSQAMTILYKNYMITDHTVWKIF